MQHLGSGPLRDAYLAPSGGLGSCRGLRTGVSPHFSTSSKREMLADHERGAAPPPSGPMPDFRGCTHTQPRSHTDCARCRSRTASPHFVRRRPNAANERRRKSNRYIKIVFLHFILLFHYFTDNVQITHRLFLNC